MNKEKMSIYLEHIFDKSPLLYNKIIDTMVDEYLSMYDLEELIFNTPECLEPLENMINAALKEIEEE